MTLPVDSMGAETSPTGATGAQVLEVGADSSPELVTRGTGASPDGGSTQGCPGKGIDNTAACNGKAGPRETATCTAGEDTQGGAAHGAAQAKALTLQQAMPMEAPEVTTCTARGHTRGQKQQKQHQQASQPGTYHRGRWLARVHVGFALVKRPEHQVHRVDPIAVPPGAQSRPPSGAHVER